MMDYTGNPAAEAQPPANVAEQKHRRKYRVVQKGDPKQLTDMMLITLNM